jgi:hypothetical protein
MADSMIDLAKLFKERNNKHWMGPLTATVVNLSPLTIRINESIMPGGQKVICGNAVRESLLINDEVIVIPSTNHQTYYVIDKAVRG